MERKITIKEEGMYKDDYQMGMLQSHYMERLLPIKGRGLDGNAYYEYDVSGKVSVKAMFEKSKMSAEDLVGLIRDVQEALSEAERYLLKAGRVLLNPEYIFYEEGKYWFCYNPKGGGNLWEEFHHLTEYMVQQADYEDSRGIAMVFYLHKATMEENYSLGAVCAEALSVMPEEKEERPAIYDKEEHDWIAEQEQGSFIMEETENMWTPVKKFLNRHKKPKWGDWDGLYVEEEDL